MALTSRRTLLQSAAGLGLSAAAFRALGGTPPSDRIRMGFIGLGGQGTGRLNQFMKQPDVVAAVVCDLDSTRAAKAAELVEKQRGQRPEVVHDFRKVLDRK